MKWQWVGRLIVGSKLAESSAGIQFRCSDAYDYNYGYGCVVSHECHNVYNSRPCCVQSNPEWGPVVASEARFTALGPASTASLRREPALVFFDCLSTSSARFGVQRRASNPVSNPAIRSRGHGRARNVDGCCGSIGYEIW